MNTMLDWKEPSPAYDTVTKMAEHQVNIKESAHEWDQQPPEFHHNTDFNQGGVVKRPLQKENPAERKSSTSDLTMDFLLEQEKRNQIRNIVVENFEKVGDHVVSILSLFLSRWIEGWFLDWRTIISDFFT